MPISLDVAGRNLKLKVIKGPSFAEERDKIKTLAGKKPIYNLDQGVSRFDYWEVPDNELGNLLNLFTRPQIICSSDKAKDLLSKFEFETLPLDSLPPYEGEIPWLRAPRFKEQETYIRLNPSKRRLIAAMQPGLGKTHCSMTRAVMVLGCKKILVVVPSVNNMATWRSEIRKSVDLPCFLYKGTPQKRKKLRELIPAEGITIATYSLVHELADCGFDEIIADEAHNVSRKKTNAFKSILKVVKKCADAGLQLLSGTPILHKPRDLWGLVYLINPQIAGEEYRWIERYEEIKQSIVKKIPMKRGGRYVVGEDGRAMFRKITIPTVVVPQNLDELAERTKSFIFRAKRSDHVTFEDKIDIEYVEMTKGQKELYRQAKEEFFLDLSQGALKLAPTKFGRMTRFLQICEGNFNLDDEDMSSSKLDYVIDVIDNLEPGEKLIVWSRFKRIGEILHAKYKSRSVLYNGELTANQRNQAVWNFQGCETSEDMSDWNKQNKGQFERPGMADVLFGVIDRGSSAGMNFHACSRQIFTSFSWNGSINEQTSARIKRLSQEADSVYTTFLINEDNSFEENALKLTLANYKTTVGILDGQDDSSYIKIDELMKLI